MIGSLCCLQCISDGKSIIMEGMHLDPSLYLYEFARSGQAHLRNSYFHSGDSFPAAAAHPESASSPLEEGATFSNGVPDTKEESDLLRCACSLQIDIALLSALAPSICIWWGMLTLCAGYVHCTLKSTALC